MQRKEIKEKVKTNIYNICSRYDVSDFTADRIVEAIEPLIIRLIDLNVRELKTRIQDSKIPITNIEENKRYILPNDVDIIFEEVKNDYRGEQWKSEYKRKYVRKCGVCGKRHEQSEMIRDNGSPNGWICKDCYHDEHWEDECEAEAEEF